MMPACEIFIKSYGCALNRYHAQHLTVKLSQKKITAYLQPFGNDRQHFRNWQESAMIPTLKFFIIWTCPRDPYLEKSTKDLTHTLKKKNRKLSIILSGCGYEFADSPLKSGAASKIMFAPSDAVYGYILRHENKLSPGDFEKNVTSDVKKTATILIKEGCAKECLLCACSSNPGHRNIDFRRIRKQIEHINGQGIQKIEFGGPCIGDWRDPSNPEFSFSHLLKYFIDKTRFQITNLEFHPNDVSDDLITLLGHARVNKEISVPIQSGSDRLLKAMKRGYDRQYLSHLYAKLFKRIPSLFLTTDIVVGFPGETRRDLLQTLEWLEEFPLTRIDVCVHSTLITGFQVSRQRKKKIPRRPLDKQLDTFKMIVRRYPRVRDTINITNR